ncbi:MAG: hypothetical protein HQL59_01540 [Magnetococcales bacterium]|nr:hypothetical protein [Magnetococcales bacterium]
MLRISSPRSGDDIVREARRLAGPSFPPGEEALLDLCDRWSRAIPHSPASRVPGAVFLGMWLRRGAMESILRRELFPEGRGAGWSPEGGGWVRPQGVGIVGHWPAANIEIMPLVSMVCALIGGNRALVRIPPSLAAAVESLLAVLNGVDLEGVMAARSVLLSFASDAQTMHEAMARCCDGALIWGGEESVRSVRALPFPVWARLQLFGPRVSVAMIDAASWRDPGERAAWATRLARDVWQFDQGACSSPQILFAERSTVDGGALLDALARALAEENRLHPRQAIEASLASAIVQARAACLLGDVANSARFPESPDYTVLAFAGPELPRVTQGRCLNVVWVDDLMQAVERLDGSFQTIGIAVQGGERERLIAERAASRGVDRIVRLGSMHLFDSPWDGMRLVAPMVRFVKYLPSASVSMQSGGVDP